MIRSDAAGVQAISTEQPRSLLEKFPIIYKQQFLFITPTFNTNNVLNLSWSHWYVGSIPDTMILVAGNVLCTVSFRLLKSCFKISVCRSLMQFTPVCSMTALMRSSPFRIEGICAVTSRKPYL